ncbi:QueT transporter family protein [Bacillus sp. JJ664]
MKLKTIAINGVFAALYIAVTFFVQPFGFSNIQFRLSEIFNHLIVFNKKYFFGIVLGVILANFFFSPMVDYDLIFGVGQTVISLFITIITSKLIKGIIPRMIVNTIVFTASMFLIAIELKLAFGLPFPITYLTTAIGEFVVMVIGIPIMYYLNKRVNFEKLI